MSCLAPNPTPNQSSLGVKARSQLQSGESCTSTLSVFSLLSVVRIFKFGDLIVPAFTLAEPGFFKI